MRNDRLYLLHIADNMAIIAEYLAPAGAGADRRLFFEDRRTQDAVLRRLETLTDAASHLSGPLKLRHPDVDWSRVTGFRNRLAHGYLGIDLELVWKAIVEDLPALKAVILRELGDGES